MFDFSILLNADKKKIVIETPDSFSKLKDVVREKSGFDEDTDVSINYFQDEEKFSINDDSDYLKFLDFADSLNQKKVDIYLKDSPKCIEDEDEEQENYNGFEVVSNGKKNIKTVGATKNHSKKTNDYCINDDLEDEDLRNPKYRKDDTGYSNQSYNFSDQKRIYYIKLKKQIQKEEQESREMSKKATKEEPIPETMTKTKKKKK